LAVAVFLADESAAPNCSQRRLELLVSPHGVCTEVPSDGEQAGHGHDTPEANSEHDSEYAPDGSSSDADDSRLAGRITERDTAFHTWNTRPTAIRLWSDTTN
jgi:hypothetical protein